MVTFVFVLLETAMFLFQFIYYLSRTQEKNRFRYLILLFLLIVYNVTGGFFPDENIPIPVIIQNMAAYGSGFIVASYIPYYFYRAFKLERLRFHALYGIYIFLILPYLVFFVVAYSVHGNLAMARKQGILIPFCYTIVLVLSILKASFLKFKEKGSKRNLTEAVVVCCAVVPWAFMPVLAYYNTSQLIEVTLCNGGFLVITIIFTKQAIDKSKEEYSKLQELTGTLAEKVKERTRHLEKLHEQRTHNFMNLVHEAKTPLTLVNNYLEAYIDKHGRGEELDIVRGGIHKLTKDITCLFDLERLEKGVCVYNHNQASNFSELLQGRLVLFEHYCQKQNITWNTDVDADVFIKADPGALDRIVNNLLENAIKFTHPGGRIAVILKATGDRVCFAVHDTGTGISIHHQKKIFEPCFHTHSKTTSLQGMGLGLPLVKRATESLGGHILVESNPQKAPGTRISVMLKRHHLMPGDIVTEAAGNSSSACNMSDFDVEDTPYIPGRQSILLVEDNRAMLYFLLKKLSLKYNLFCAVNGAEALKKLHELPVLPDLILSDIRMDKLDGFGLARIIAEHTAYQHIPFIFLSAKSSPADILKGLRLGAIDFIQKPFSFQVLTQKIDSVLGNITNQKRAVLQATVSNLKALSNAEEIAASTHALSALEQNCKQYKLTCRETDVVRLIQRGLKYKTMAEDLFISERTVTKHVQNIFEKVGVSNKVALLHKLGLWQPRAPG